jgi:putative transposase
MDIVAYTMICVISVARLMRENKIHVKTKKQFKITTDSNHSKSIYQNKLDRQFNPSKPYKRWPTDITYIPTREGWLYLAIVMDLFSRKKLLDGLCLSE